MSEGPSAVFHSWVPELLRYMAAEDALEQEWRQSGRLLGEARRLKTFEQLRWMHGDLKGE